MNSLVTLESLAIKDTDETKLKGTVNFNAIIHVGSKQVKIPSVLLWPSDSAEKLTEQFYSDIDGFLTRQEYWIIDYLKFMGFVFTPDMLTPEIMETANVGVA